MLLVSLKVFLVPLLILCITLAGRKWGAHIAGWLSAFPVVGGPILLFIAVEQGAHFASVAAKGMFSTIIVNIGFAVVYANMARRYAWPVCITVAFLVYAVLLLLLHSLGPSLMLSLGLIIVVLFFAPNWFPQVSMLEAATHPSPFELPLRMLAGALLVMLVTYFSSQLGSRLSGMLAMFPVMASVLAVFSHRQSGSEFSIQLLRGALLGWYAFSAFSLVLALILPISGISIAFVLAFLTALLVQTITLVFVKRLALKAL
jgi:hypothetical protein